MRVQERVSLRDTPPLVSTPPGWLGSGQVEMIAAALTIALWQVHDSHDC